MRLDAKTPADTAFDSLSIEREFEERLTKNFELSSMQLDAVYENRLLPQTAHWETFKQCCMYCSNFNKYDEYILKVP